MYSHQDKPADAESGQDALARAQRDLRWFLDVSESPRRLAKELASLEVDGRVQPGDGLEAIQNAGVAQVKLARLRTCTATPAARKAEVERLQAAVTAAEQILAGPHAHNSKAGEAPARPTGNGFVATQPPVTRSMDPSDVELFLATAALARQTDVRSFLGRKITTTSDTVAFADEAPASAETGEVIEITQGHVEGAEHLSSFMRRLSIPPSDAQDEQARPGEHAPKAESATRPVDAAALLKRFTYEILTDGSVVYRLDQVDAFTDHGRNILMAKGADDNRDVILAALMLAKEKFKMFELTGTPEFQRLAIEVMVANGLEMPLSNSAQIALRDELMAAKPDSESSAQDSDTANPATEHVELPASNGIAAAAEVAPFAPSAPESDNTGSAGTTLDPPLPAGSPQPALEQGGSPVARSDSEAANEEAAQRERETPTESPAAKYVDAVSWWKDQAKIIDGMSINGQEKYEALRALGPTPADGTLYWFDRAGNPCRAPDDLTSFPSAAARPDSRSPIGVVPQDHGEALDQAVRQPEPRRRAAACR